MSVPGGSALTDAADANTGAEPARSPVQKEGDRRLQRIARAGKQWKRTMGTQLIWKCARLWADDREAMAYNTFIALVLVPVHVVSSRRPQLRLSRAQVPVIISRLPGRVLTRSNGDIIHLAKTWVQDGVGTEDLEMVTYKWI
ncbi:hypothetical protein DFH09DRAFT_1105292 [Mycena vulgaris]|nr:hypothetical protein DFH09DRAFT_1108943 [Mycena vulgaris]KAJ6489714.1 hypothetical protein DFH09DRAFT_1105292 [Mycena vulgaris]